MRNRRYKGARPVSNMANPSEERRAPAGEMHIIDDIEYGNPIISVKGTKTGWIGQYSDGLLQVWRIIPGKVYKRPITMAFERPWMEVKP